MTIGELPTSYLETMTYYEMLVETNKGMNLTAITELDEVITKHFVDSIALAAVYPEIGDEDNIINDKRPNHQGIEIGRVIRVTKDKVYIKLDKILNQEDGIRFKTSGLGMIANMIYNDKDLLINKGLLFNLN